MAEKNGRTPKTNPDLPSNAAAFLKLFESRSPEEQAAFLAKHKIVPAPRPRALIRLDFKPYDILDDLERCARW